MDNDKRLNEVEKAEWDKYFRKLDITDVSEVDPGDVSCNISGLCLIQF